MCGGDIDCRAHARGDAQHRRELHGELQPAAGNRSPREKHGKPRKVVAVPSKQAWLYVFDRITGEPIWPIEERPVPQSDMPGEKTAKTQPFVTKPPAYARTHVSEDDLIDFTPALRKQALENLKLFRWEQTPYVPPVAP